MATPLRRSEKLLLVVVGISLLHHLDHVLRVDHSGWPFVAQVSPFTYSLLAYPILISIFVARAAPWYRVAATAELLLFATLAHLFFEPLRDKFHTWAYGSDLPGHAGEQNLLHYHSKVLGACSVGLAILLSAALLAAVWAFFGEAKPGRAGRPNSTRMQA